MCVGDGDETFHQFVPKNKPFVFPLLSLLPVKTFDAAIVEFFEFSWGLEFWKSSVSFVFVSFFSPFIETKYFFRNQN
jgi:hypothetical protein